MDKANRGSELLEIGYGCEGGLIATNNYFNIKYKHIALKV